MRIFLPRRHGLVLSSSCYVFLMRRESSFPVPAWRSFMMTRRLFLQGLISTFAASQLSKFAGALPAPTYPFVEVPPLSSGINWVHTAGKSALKHLPEISGAGCAFLDYDNDGWVDIYLVNSGQADFYTPAKPLRNALYHNNRDGTFTDIYVTQYDRSILYHNNGNGTFTDVTERAGVAAPGWSSSAAWFDYDNDGRLDLFVCHFAAWDPSQTCGITADGAHHYCIPRIFKPTSSWLFHNNGDGTFTDVSKEAGIAEHLGKAWGVVATDINNDGRMDIFVSHDTVANSLYLNKGDGRFEEIGLPADVAYSAEGKARSGMGVDSADFNQDGWMDIFVANIDEEIFSLYKNNGDNTFDDLAMPMGVGMPTRWMSGWGLKFFDHDNDGNLDIIVANGFPDDLVEQFSNRVTFKERILLFHNSGKEFQDVSAQSGPVFAKTFSSRGLAVGDFNNDGGLDVLISVNDEAPVLLRNDVGKLSHWLGVKLVGTKCNADAVGARITYQSGDLKRGRFKTGGGSFLSSHDPRVVLGIGNRTKLDWVEVTWPQPSGAVERFINLPIDRYVTLVEGSGKWK